MDRADGRPVAPGWAHAHRRWEKRLGGCPSYGRGSARVRRWGLTRNLDDVGTDGRVRAKSSRGTWAVGIGAPCIGVHTYPENRQSLPHR
jgi:hypothetical protein